MRTIWGVPEDEYCAVVAEVQAYAVSIGCEAEALSEAAGISVEAFYEDTLGDRLACDARSKGWSVEARAKALADLLELLP
jgi:hypothetical protein